MVLPIQGSAWQCKATQRNARQSKAVRAQAFTGGFSCQRNARHRSAQHRSARHGKAEQSGSAIGNSGLPGGFSYQRTATHGIA